MGPVPEGRPANPPTVQCNCPGWLVSGDLAYLPVVLIGRSSFNGTSGRQCTGPFRYAKEKHVKKNELIADVALKTDLTKIEAGNAVEALIEAITESLVKKGEVKLVGFGSFTTDVRQVRKGRDPRTGEEIQIKQTTVVKFKPGKGLKDAVTGQDEDSQ
ncbi:TPA: HU family DNA-binding protein [Pseudomonas putida]|nr:HU family DNA-binding protein [Pseudomonas putida]HEK1693626.1 HU family DNA-binding protein [Pseudomonas putida]